MMNDAQNRNAQPEEDHPAGGPHRLSSGQKMTAAIVALAIIGATVYVAGLLNAQLVGAEDGTREPWVLYSIYAVYLGTMGTVIHGMRLLFD
jgi:hypothetical protein